MGQMDMCRKETRVPFGVLMLETFLSHVTWRCEAGSWMEQSGTPEWGINLRLINMQITLNTEEMDEIAWKEMRGAEVSPGALPHQIEGQKKAEHAGETASEVGGQPRDCGVMETERQSRDQQVESSREME